MSIAIITGSAGLIGSEAARFFSAKGFDIVGIDNDMRSYFFGAEASTKKNKERLEADLVNYRHESLDIRDNNAIDNLFKSFGKDISIIVHTAAQPSHDWAAKEPFTDFEINANGTLHMLEATRKHCPEAVFIFTSTNKVYGDTPNTLPLVEQEMRWEVSSEHHYSAYGIDESMSVDFSTHSLFGVSKLAADVLVQEYGRYFGMKTTVFRGGCLTGPAHSGAKLHGFLSYLIISAVKNLPYTVFGYKGKQVRDNIHSADLVQAFWCVYENPRCGEIYNMGGSRHSNISMLEAIHKVEKLTGRSMNYSISEQNRIGDHIWYISDVRKFKTHYPDWSYCYDMDKILDEMVASVMDRV